MNQLLAFVWSCVYQSSGCFRGVEPPAVGGVELQLVARQDVTTTTQHCQDQSCCVRPLQVLHSDLKSKNVLLNGSHDIAKVCSTPAYLHATNCRLLEHVRANTRVQSAMHRAVDKFSTITRCMTQCSAYFATNDALIALSAWLLIVKHGTKAECSQQANCRSASKASLPDCT